MLVLNGVEYRTCPIREAAVGGIEMIATFAAMLAPAMGSPVFPYGGGIMEQPAPLMDAINLFVGERVKHEKPNG